MFLILFLVWEKFPACAELCDEVIKQKMDCAEFLCEPDFRGCAFWHSCSAVITQVMAIYELVIKEMGTEK